MVRTKAQAMDSPQGLCSLLYPSRCPFLYLSAQALRDARLLVLPIGSFEDHQKAPMTLDTLLALVVACTASHICGTPGTAILWPLGYGYSPLHRYWVGLGPEQVAGLVRALLRSARGITATEARLAVIDGHYGHREVVEEAAMGEGACYFNVWSALYSLGLRSFEEQLGFEKNFWRTCLEGTGPIDMVTGLIEGAARAFCEKCG